MTLTLGASTLAAAPASAQTDNATETAAIVDGIGGVETGETLTATVDGFTTTAPGSSVTIPGDASGDIEIDSDLGGVAIGIPGDTHHSGVLVGDDDVVYDNVLTDTNIVAQATEDGAQILLTLESSAAPASFDFPVEVPEDGRLQLNADGSASIMADLDGVDGTTETVEVGTIATPWATDANQTPVPTRFTVEGTTLTQHIEHTNTEYAYPIVADPEYHSTWYGKFTIKLTTSELNKLTGAMLLGWGTYSIVCSGTTAGLCSLPSGVVGGILASMRGALGLCANSKGVDIHYTAIPRVAWCNGY